MAHDATLPHAHPTHPTVPLTLKKVIYQLSFPFKALALAEAELKKAGHPVNLFNAVFMDDLDATKLTALLYAGMITAHPDTKLEDVPSMITMRQVGKITDALVAAIALAFVDPDEAAKDGAGPLDE